jgi:short-subunit dehydrogenase
MVVTVASLASFITVPRMVDYGASKAAAMAFHEGLTAELATVYQAPRVRTICINQGYTKTALFQGYTNDAGFMMPTLEVDTVAEEIAKAILAGHGAQVVIPGGGVITTFLRGFPHYLQRKLRHDGVKIMEKWHGRQVIDVEKEYMVEKAKEAKEAVKSAVEGSTVLVDRAAAKAGAAADAGLAKAGKA